MKLLLKNAAVFNGVDDGLSPGLPVLIEDNRIAALGAEAAEATADQVLDLAGMTLLPGLIDMHVHLIGLSSFSPGAILTEEYPVRAPRAVADAKRLLEAGFTTVRCAGSDLSVGLKQAIEEGIVPGPRIFASNQIITQTGGHADLHLVPQAVVRQAVPFFRLADGAGDCRRAVREQVRAGADQIKICATGGISSERDDPHRQEFSDAELAVLVEEAHRCGKRVMAHAQGTAGIQAAARAGVDTIEHGIYLDEPTVELLLERRITIVTTFTILDVFVEQAEALGASPAAIGKAQDVHGRYAESIRLAHRCGVPLAAGTDCFGGPVMKHGINARELELLVTLVGMSPAAALQSATTNAARALGWEDKLGVLQVGAFADVIAVDFDPLQEIALLQNVERVRGVIKNGQIKVLRRLEL